MTYQPKNKNQEQGDIRDSQSKDQKQQPNRDRQGGRQEREGTLGSDKTTGMEREHFRDRETDR